MESFDFDEIRPFRDHEIHDKIVQLIREPIILDALPKFFPLVPIDVLIEKLLNIRTVEELQREIMGKLLLKGLETTTSSGIAVKGAEKLNKNTGYLFISNHRDIVLDSAFLNYKLLQCDLPLTEIAIGDNLLIFPWIKDLVRINRNFIVQRNAPIREMLFISKRLSAYIRQTITERNQSIWIAQREGRAKDSDDRTQEALLKMFNMSGENELIDNLADLNVCPLTISYEYDPCDYLKAKEFQLKRDNPDYKKQPNDDLLNMITGIKGFKGRIIFHFTGNICENLKKIKETVNAKNEQLTSIASLIDYHIHSNYEIFPGNMVAYDLLLKTNKFSDQYSITDRSSFETYLQQQVDKIDIEGKDEAYLRERILEMYANPLINKLKTD
jgi:hypothetical protein